MSAVRLIESRGAEVRLSPSGGLVLSGLDSIPADDARELLEYAKGNKAALVDELAEAQVKESRAALGELLAILDRESGLALHFYQLKPVPAFALIEMSQEATAAFSEAFPVFLKAVDAIAADAPELARQGGQGYLLGGV
ncbi:hypothetical protein [Desulfovibrio oxyclinae]|uniref:hypothetical protein n=1 Tax=Desulfovibrio oxyclinae TaxID=63560 RepID=UPI000377B923|nr:hypothetical protein [Desulfovibrio oxyclinae]